jgi:hypothetical protein
MLARQLPAGAAARVPGRRADIDNRLVEPAAASARSPQADGIATDIKPRLRSGKFAGGNDRGTVRREPKHPFPRPDVHVEHSSWRD